jgi:hypothetical protein
MPGKTSVTSEGLMGADHPFGSLVRLRAMSGWYAGEELLLFCARP